MNPLDTPGVPFDIALMNPNPTSSKTKDGPIYRISFELDRDTWQNFMDAETKGMILAGRMIRSQDGEMVAEGRPIEKPYSQEAKTLYQSGFFRSPAVWRAIGTDADYQAWCRLQPCSVCGGADLWEERGEMRCEYSHILSADALPDRGEHKPAYSGVPMCRVDHVLHHSSSVDSATKAAKGKAISSAREFWQRKKIEHAQEWAKSALVGSFGLESLAQIPPADLAAWAADKGLETFLPAAYRGSR